MPLEIKYVRPAHIGNEHQGRMAPIWEACMMLDGIIHALASERVEDSGIDYSDAVDKVDFFGDDPKIFLRDWKFLVLGKPVEDTNMVPWYSYKPDGETMYQLKLFTYQDVWPEKIHLQIANSVLREKEEGFEELFSVAIKAGDIVTVRRTMS